MPALPGMFKGLAVTGRTLLRTLFPDGLKKPIPQPSKGAHTVQYPHVKEAPPTRARGVIALHEENCTSCMLCARECPDWCIYIEGHKELAPPRRAGGKPRQKNKLDRFDIDFSLCMYCGICVEVCPFEALFWTPEYEFSELRIADLLHDKDRLGEWMHTVPDFEDYESGSDQKVKKVPRSMVAQNIFFGIMAAGMIGSALKLVTTDNVVHAALWLMVVLAGTAGQFLLIGAEFVGVTQVLVYIGAIVVLFLFGIMLTRASIGGEDNPNLPNKVVPAVVALLLLGVMSAAVIDKWRDDELPEERVSTVQQVSDSIFSDFIVPFEATSVLLLAALIGAIVVARKE